VYGILGNHDFIEFVPALEAAGMRMLLNENVQLQRGSDSIYLAGIDDPHFYETHDVQRAARGVPQDAYSILLSHTPESYRLAAACRFDLMLCGHTHGGQICLPGGVPVLTNSGCPRTMVRGDWTYQDLSGYTSPGTGSAGVPARFFCPPEITLHRLCRNEDGSEAAAAKHLFDKSSKRFR
jgi:predicted MPP superfamily phosphohydrolase